MEIRPYGAPSFLKSLKLHGKTGLPGMKIPPSGLFFMSNYYITVTLEKKVTA